MASPQCDYSDKSGNRCTNDAPFRCTGPHCRNGVYCSRHSRMQNGTYICDICTEKQEELDRLKSARERAEAARRAKIEKEVSERRAKEEAKEKEKLNILLGIGLALIVIGFIVGVGSPGSSPPSSGPSTGIVIGAIFFWAGAIVLIVRHFRKP